MSVGIQQRHRGRLPPSIDPLQNHGAAVPQHDDCRQHLAQLRQVAPAQPGRARLQAASLGDAQQLLDRRLSGAEHVVVDQLRDREVHAAIAGRDD